MTNPMNRRAALGAIAAATPEGQASSIPRLFYTIAEATAATGVSRRTIERRIADGTLRVNRKFGVPLIPVAELTDEAEGRSRRARRSSRRLVSGDRAGL